MSAKKYLVAAIGLNAALLAFAVVHIPTGTMKRGTNDVSGKFGPVVETVLPPAGGDSSVDILDLETGRTVLQPPIESFNSGAAIMGWIRSHSLDISCFTWSTSAACITYDMTVVPVERRLWDNTTERDLIENPALAPALHSPRRLLVLGPGRPHTYLLRTGEGTLGMLRIVGAEQHGKGVKVQYKLVNPPTRSAPPESSK